MNDELNDQEGSQGSDPGGQPVERPLLVAQALYEDIIAEFSCLQPSSMTSSGPYAMASDVAIDECHLWLLSFTGVSAINPTDAEAAQQLHQAMRRSASLQGADAEVAKRLQETRPTTTGHARTASERPAKRGGV